MEKSYKMQQNHSSPWQGNKIHMRMGLPAAARILKIKKNPKIGLPVETFLTQE